MTKRELIEALERSSVEDWAPVLVNLPGLATNPNDVDRDVVGTLTIHTTKRQEITLTID